MVVAHVLIIPPEKKMKASILFLQDKFPVDPSKDSSHIFDVWFSLDNGGMGWKLGRGTSPLALPMHEWLYT